MTKSSNHATLPGVRLPTLALLLLPVCAYAPENLRTTWNSFVQASKAWAALEEVRPANTVDIPTVRAWKEVKARWKDVRVVVDHEYE